MKTLKIIVLALAILLPSSAFSGDLGALRITLIEGDAYIYTDDSGEWLDASANMPLVRGDRLWVPEGGRAELRLRGGGYARLDGRTMLDVLTVDDNTAEFSLTEGRLYVNAEKNYFTPVLVTTPTSSARVRDAIAMFDVAETGASRISALKGSVEAQTRDGAKWLEAGESLHVDDALYASVSRLGEPDEWERWNRRRDGDPSGSYASARYLPEELNEYAYDFDRGGNWVYASGYGYVWTPTVSISIGWAPYRHGRWAWAGGDYVWVSYEPWGWAPYHYGRWAHVPRIGWCWVPPRHREVYWGPGYVAWVYTPTYVAWVPLAPGETYYGYGHYGPGSVNIVNININKTVINNVHKNVHVKDAVTVVHRDTFMKGKKVDFRLKGNPFVAERPHMGPPHERPERHGDAAYAGRDRERNRPPAGANGPRADENRKPGKPSRTGGLSVKSDAQKRETPPGKIAVPSGKRGVERPAAIAKERVPLRADAKPTSKFDNRRKETPPGRLEARAERPREDRPSALGNERKPLKTERPSSIKPASVRREAPPMRADARPATRFDTKKFDTKRREAPRGSFEAPSAKSGERAEFFSRKAEIFTKKLTPGPAGPPAHAPAVGKNYQGKRGVEAGKVKEEPRAARGQAKGAPKADAKASDGKPFSFFAPGTRGGKIR